MTENLQAEVPTCMLSLPRVLQARAVPCRRFMLFMSQVSSHRSFPHGAAQILQQAFNERNIRYPTRSQKKTLANATVCLVSFAPGLI